MSRIAPIDHSCANVGHVALHPPVALGVSHSHPHSQGESE